MPITYVRGSLFESPAQVLVNTVNTVGVMGKGVALEFKKTWPEMFQEYRDLCERKKLDIGRLHLYKASHKWILNFPTKKHWRQPSRVEYVEAGLKRFVEVYADASVHSIAFPPLGCGNGQLDFRSQVGPLMEKHLGNLPISTFIYLERPMADPPEHRDQKRIREWLRSEPQSLPFDEVWEDLSAIVGTDRRFETYSKQTKYHVTAESDPLALHIETSGKKAKKYRIGYEDLLEFWQQLRQHGFIFRGITPEHYRTSYLLPVFEELEYVQRVKVSPTDVGLERQPFEALQVVPPPRQDSDSQGDLFE